MISYRTLTLSVFKYPAELFVDVKTKQTIKQHIISISCCCSAANTEFIIVKIVNSASSVGAVTGPSQSQMDWGLLFRQLAAQ